jgi:hypothetical protein
MGGGSKNGGDVALEMMLTQPKIIPTPLMTYRLESVANVRKPFAAQPIGGQIQ